MARRVRAIPRDVQFEPVRDFIIHVDFLRLGKDARVAVEVPVHFKNQEASPGIKAGGALNIVSHTVSLYCSANLIPDEIMVDLTGIADRPVDPSVADQAAGWRYGGQQG